VRTHRMQKLGMTAVCVFMLGAAGASQEKPNAAPLPVAAADAGTPPPLLRVQITVARYQGEKKISSAPYTLLMNADGQRGGLRMGAQVPVPVAPGGTDRPAQAVQYRDIGTSIDCSARPTANGMYQMELSIEDSSMVADESQAGTVQSAVPSFRVFRASHRFAAREGQLTQFVAATDRASGDVMRIELTFTKVS
jgi:type II secretory pathway component GspD/PulD (secretin)